MLNKQDHITAIAHILTGSIATSCCFKTGGKGGPSAHKECECRYLAKLILEKLGLE